MFKSVEDVQQKYKVGTRTASFLYTLGRIPAKPEGFPVGIPIEDIVSIIQKEENLSPEEAQLQVRWALGDIHRSRAVDVIVEV